MKVVEEVMTRNCSRKDSDFILGNILLATYRVSVNSVSLAITGTRYLQIVLIVKLLILLRSIYCLHWNLELYWKVIRHDSRQYTAKACAYLCQHCMALLASVNSVNSRRYSIEYPSRKLLDSSSTTNLIIMDHNAIRHINSCRVRVIIPAWQVTTDGKLMWFRRFF